MADIKPSVLSWLIVTLMAVTGVAFLKWFVAKFPVPGLSDLVAAV